MNVHDNLKTLTVPEIKNHYIENSIPAAIGMTHVSHDFNLGNVIRSANFFGFKEVFYIGGKKGFDRRSTVGCHNYIPLHFFRTEEEFIESIYGKYELICIENNIPEFKDKTMSIFDDNAYYFSVMLPPLFLFGEEQLGISKFLLEKAKIIWTIPSNGTVRSLNVGSCAAIVMAMYKDSIKL
jgi:tRNA G18 (ribose-2'-O)-methylase SpoU